MRSNPRAGSSPASAIDRYLGCRQGSATKNRHAEDRPAGYQFRMKYGVCRRGLLLLAFGGSAAVAATIGGGCAAVVRRIGLLAAAADGDTEAEDDAECEDCQFLQHAFSPMDPGYQQ